MHSSNDPSISFDAVVQVPPGKERWCSLAPNFHRHSTQTLQQHPVKSSPVPFIAVNSSSAVTIDIEGFQPIANIGMGTVGRNVYPLIPIIDSTHRKEHPQSGSSLFGLGLVVSSSRCCAFSCCYVPHEVKAADAADADVESLLPLFLRSLSQRIPNQTWSWN